MAGNFKGWLIKFGNVKLPNIFLLSDGWNTSPNKRLEISAYRDANTLLHRETSENYKTSIKLNIRGMTLLEMEAFNKMIGLATLPSAERKERKLAVTYWNDETLEYTTADMYMTDTSYSIHKVDEKKNSIIYNPFTIELIEY